jgi:CBS domain-containing protein
MPGSLKRSEELFPDRVLRQILAGRAATLHVVTPGETAERALVLMAQHDIGLLLVMEGERLVGVLSERDLVRHAGPGEPGVLRQRIVADLMTRDVVTVTPDASFGQCMALMDERGARHLPVLDGGRVVAVLSVRDLLREAVAQHRRVLAEVERERLMAFQHIG